jgi:hypothetical protein
LLIFNLLRNDWLIIKFLNQTIFIFLLTTTHTSTYYTSTNNHTSPTKWLLLRCVWSHFNITFILYWTVSASYFVGFWDLYWKNIVINIETNINRKIMLGNTFISCVNFGSKGDFFFFTKVKGCDFRIESWINSTL